MNRLFKKELRIKDMLKENYLNLERKLLKIKLCNDILRNRKL